MSVHKEATPKMHLFFYGISLLGEINAIRRQLKDKDKKLIYFSHSLSQLELLWELYFRYLNETVEPIIYFFEGLKCLLKLKEYIGLITKERMSLYVSKELYENHKQDEDKKKSMVLLPRSKKMLPKPDDFVYSKKMLKYALKSSISVDSLQSVDEVQFSSDPSKLISTSVRNLDQPLPEKKNIVSKMFAYIFKKLKFVGRLAFSRKFKIMELLLILRPFLYMFLLLKYGKESYRPFMISLLIEFAGIISSLFMINSWKTETEKEELKGRWKYLLKYFLKEPFFSQYTIRIVYILLHRFISDRKIKFVLSILTYFEYYTYIV